MEALIAEQDRMIESGSLGKSVDDIQKTIDLLVNAREAVASDFDNAPLLLTKLQTPARESFEVINKDLKDVYKHLNNYDKALTKKFKDKPLPSEKNDALSSQTVLINRAIAMHLLREGQFSVASQFLDDAVSNAPPVGTDDEDAPMRDSQQLDISIDGFRSEELRDQFANMYHILHELKTERNLLPAVSWARTNSKQLETRGSNLEFELGRLQYVSLYTGSSVREPRPMEALKYAREHLSQFQGRYLKEVQQLAGAMAFGRNLASSPYKQTFSNDREWDHLAHMFTREFCSLLGLSAQSPLYVAATAGAIALPTLLKLQNIMKEKRTEWTTAQELPVETPLPPSYHFHSIFVCPVSKEQTTDENPPMMMPCGHVIAQETLARMSKGTTFKCPYCPNESRPADAKKLYM